MKRRCGKCRALNPASWTCELGYKTKRVYYDVCITMDAKPTEECPKPLTYAALAAQWKRREELT